MFNGLRRLLNVRHNYINPLLQQRAQNLIVMLWGAIIFLALLALVQSVIAVVQQTVLTNVVEIGILILALLGAYYLIQRGRLDAAIWAFIGLMIIALIPVIAVSLNPVAPIALVIPLVAGALLLSRRSLFFITLLFIATLLFHAFNQSQSVGVVRYIPADNAIPDLINYCIALGLAAVFLFVFSGSAERLAAVSIRDVSQLKAAGRFSSVLVDAIDENELLLHLLESIQNDLNFGLAQIYLPDTEGKYSRRLRLGLGQSANVTLRESEVALLDEASKTLAPILLSLRDARTRADHLVPPAREGVLLALVSGETMLGILDVQGEQSELFTENAIAALYSLAMQTVHEVIRVRQIQDLQRTVHEQEMVIDRFNNQMSEFQQRAQGMTNTNWSRYLEGRNQENFGFDYDGSMVVPSDSLPDDIRETIERGDISIQRKETMQVVSVPITLRDQVIGAFTFNLPNERTVNERQLELLRTVANRLGVALESNRLLEQTQAQALRERRASEIGSLLLSATDIETVLDLAASSFNEALGAVHTRVYLDPGRLVHSGELQ